MQLVRNILSNHVVQMFLRYVAVGGGTFLVDLCCFLLLVKQAGISPEVAQACSRTVGAAVGFFGHKYFSFAQPEAAGSKGRSSSVQVVGYICIMVAGIVLSPFVIWFMLRIVQPHLVLAKILTEGVMVCINFVLMKALFSRLSKSPTHIS
ncbi:GtrA family protein [Caballeronia sp. LjRoot31]|uniref:GtrA family protein n=1 Tax=Caballeronia sp. LjRoot31 TaxID=3342324 RepID=UPI003ECF57F3